MTFEIAITTPFYTPLTGNSNSRFEAMCASIVKFDLKTKLNVYKFHSNEQNINIFRKK